VLLDSIRTLAVPHECPVGTLSQANHTLKTAFDAFLDRSDPEEVSSMVYRHGVCSGFGPPAHDPLYSRVRAL
jgi:hypothetical protein